MNWFFIALVAPFLWSIVNVSDKYLVSKYSKKERDSGGLIIFISIIGIFAALIIGIFTKGIFEISILDKLMLIAVGGITIAWTVLYFFALEIEGVSAVASWFLIIPVFGYIFGYLFLGETLSVKQLIGSCIILIGVFLISLNWSKKKNKFKYKSKVYILLACILVALSGVIFKYVAASDKFWISSFWQYVGIGIFGIAVYFFIPKYHRNFLLMIRSNGIKIFILSSINEILNIVGNLFTNYAILLAPITMVYLVGSFQPAIVLILSFFMMRSIPIIGKEKIPQKALLPKIIAIGVTVTGSIILFL